VAAYRTSNQSKLYFSQSNDGKRLYRTLNHLRDGIWSHHGRKTALLEIELTLPLFAVPITRSIHAVEVSVVRVRFRSLSNVNLSGSQNASKKAAAAAEKTE